MHWRATSSDANSLTRHSGSGQAVAGTTRRIRAIVPALRTSLRRLRHPVELGKLPERRPIIEVARRIAAIRPCCRTIPAHADTDDRDAIADLREHRADDVCGVHAVVVRDEQMALVGALPRVPIADRQAITIVVESSLVERIRPEPVRWRVANDLRQTREKRFEVSGLFVSLMK